MEGALSMDYTFSYLIADIALLVVWLVFFIARPDVRNQMLTMSVFFGLAGLFVQPLYMHDWWRPLTATNTAIGIEDFLFGAAIGGVAAVAYEIVYRKKFRPRRVNVRQSLLDKHILLIASGLCAVLFFGLFYAIGTSSFYASVTGLSSAIALMWIQRPDLIADSVASGILLVFFGYVWFWVPEIVTPGWVETYWLHDNLFGIFIMTAPLEDFIWGLLVGMYIGPLYEFWNEKKLFPLKS